MGGRSGREARCVLHPFSGSPNHIPLSRYSPSPLRVRVTLAIAGAGCGERCVSVPDAAVRSPGGDRTAGFGNGGPAVAGARCRTVRTQPPATGPSTWSFTESSTGGATRQLGTPSCSSATGYLDSWISAQCEWLSWCRVKQACSAL